MIINSIQNSFLLYLVLVKLYARLAYGWQMQLCVNGSLYETSSDSCKHGIWFTSPTIVHKICFEHGIWAIYKEFCEENPTIWSVLPGSRGCVRHEIHGKRIVGIVSLGNDESAGAIVSTSNRRLFLDNYKLKHGLELTFITDPATIEILTWGPPPVKFSLHQRVNNGKGTLQHCLLKETHAFFGYYKVTVENPSNASFYLAKNVCKSPSTVQTGVGGNRVQTLPVEIDFNILQSSPGEFEDDLNCEKNSKIDELKNQDLPDLNGIMTVENNGKILPKSVIHNIEHRVDEETHKLALRLLAYHFNHDKFHHKLETLKLFDKSKEILLKACPAQILSRFFIEEIDILFQAVLELSVQIFPPRIDRDEVTTNRVSYALQLCMKNSTEFEFHLPKNCSSEAPLLKQVFPNGTKYHLLIEMPQFIKNDPVNYDLLMESIWKIMSFPHYHCAEFFREYATDHSVLQARWLQIVSPLLLRRWKYPGRGYHVFKKIFNSINLEDSIKNLDYCVSAARYHSTYKGWLKRPVVHWYKEKSPKSKSNKDQPPLISIGDDTAYCVSDFMDPALRFPHNLAIERCGILPPN